MDNEVLDRIAAAIESLDKPGLPEMDVYRLTVALESTARNLDKLVALLATPQTVTQAAAPQAVTQTEPEEKAVEAPEAPGKEAPVAGRTRTEETLYREELKKELREKGIAFKEAAKTTTLEKLVAVSRQEAAPTCCTPQSRTWAKIEVNGGTREVLYCTTCGRIGRVLENGVEQEVAPDARFTPPAPAVQELPPEPEPEPSNVIAHTMDQVRGAIVGLAKVRGRDVAREILEKYGHATLIPEVDMQYYATIIAKCEEAMKEGVRNAA